MDTIYQDDALSFRNVVKDRTFFFCLENSINFFVFVVTYCSIYYPLLVIIIAKNNYRINIALTILTMV